MALISRPLTTSIADRTEAGPVEGVIGPRQFGEILVTIGLIALTLGDDHVCWIN